MKTYILLECEGPEAASEAEALGGITGVLAQHGALGVHQTVHGEFTVSLLAGGTVKDAEAAGPSALELIQALRALAFDANRTPRVCGGAA